MKKILFMIPNLMHGGAEKVLVNLLNNMDIREFDITLMTLFDDGVNKQFLKPHIRYISYYKKVFRGNSYYFKLFSPKSLYRKMIKDNYDIIVSYLEGPTARIVSGCSNPKTKLVSWIHVEQHDKRTACKAFRNYKESYICYSKYHQFVCVSQTVKEDFLSIFNLDNKCDVIYNTNETDLILEQSKEEVDDIVINPANINLCGVGKLMPNKGFDRIIHITKKLFDEGYNVNTYILGVGSHQTKYENLVTSLNLNKNVFLLGYKTNPYKYVANCDLFLCASYAEGFSTAATESLIVGTPVCTVEVSGMKEMLGENNEYGIVVENNDEALYQAIKGLLDNPQILAHYKEKAIERGKEFSKEMTVKAVEEMLRKL